MSGRGEESSLVLKEGTRIEGGLILETEYQEMGGMIMFKVWGNDLRCVVQ